MHRSILFSLLYRLGGMIIIKANEKLTILYARLSQDDHNLGDSNSIINQKLILEKYAKDNGFKNTLFLSDDGYTGTNFDRPAFNEIIELIEQGKVGTVIVKDLSRFGRNYIVAGQYLEEYFPSHNVHFMAINDGVDSRDENSNDFTPMKNYFNEYYAKDCSKKCRASIKIKAATGARVGSRPPFGYKKDPNDPKRKIVIDEDTAPIVKYIFSLCVSGMGPAVIANQLEAEEILNPSHSYFNKYGVKMTGYYPNKPYRWTCPTVSKILENEVYIGNTINLRSSTLSYKHKKKIQLPRESQFVFENTHEAIVDKEVWDIVQQIRKNKKRRPNMAEQNIFSGIILCDTCGKKLTLNRSRRSGKEKNYFCCGRYRKTGSAACSSHRINERELYAIILDDLNRITYYARLNEKLFVDKIAAMNNKNLGKNIANLENELEDYI